MSVRLHGQPMRGRAHELNPDGGVQTDPAVAACACADREAARVDGIRRGGRGAVRARLVASCVVWCVVCCWDRLQPGSQGAKQRVKERVKGA